VDGLHDRALIALLVYTFARVSAALHMNVEDYYPQGNAGGSASTSSTKCRRTQAVKDDPRPVDYLQK